MKLRHLHLTGFGHFGDVDLPADGADLSGRLTVIHGPNEAGKSTLLEFIRTMLFGFPVRERDRRFPPLAGGRHGGRLHVLDDEERAYVIERFAGRGSGTLTVSAERGRRVDPATLQRMLGHASALLFKNVFAFDLDQLRDVTALQEAGVTDSIYSAGVGAAGLTQALAQFDASCLKIYRPNGRKQPVAQVLAGLASVEEKLAASAAAASQYGKLRAERETAERALAKADAARTRAQHESVRAVRLHDAWSDWVTLREVERELERIAPRPEFPSDATTRLENAEASLAEVSARFERERTELARCRSAAAAIKFDAALLETAAEIETLRRKRDSFTTALDELPTGRAERQSLEQEVAQDVGALGRAWNADRVERFDTSAPVRKELAEVGAACNGALQSQRDAEIACASADRRLRDESARLDAVREALHEIPDPILDAETLGARRAAVNRLRDELVSLDAARTLRDQEHTRLGELQTQRPEAQPLPFWQRTEWIGAGATAAVGALALAGGVLAGGTGLIFGLVAAGLLAATAIFLALRARKAPVPLAWKQFDKAIRAQKERAEAAAQAVQAIEARLPERAAEAALGEAASESDVAEAKEGLDAAQKVLDMRLEHEGDLRAVERQVRLAQQDVERARTAAKEADASAEAARRAWTLWLDSRELAETMQPDEVTELFGRLDTVRAKLRQLADRRRRLAAIEHDVEEFCGLAEPLLEQRGEARYQTPAQLGPAVDALIAAFDASREAKEEKERLAAQVKVARRRLADVTAEQKHAEEALRHLLASAGVDDPVEYRRLAAQQARRAELEPQARECIAGLVRRSGPGQAFEEFRATLEASDLDSLQRNRQRTADRLADQEERRDQLIARLGELQQQLTTLEHDISAAELRQDREALQTELAAQAREWATLTLAKALLEQARRRYEEERQPEVVRRAEEYFGRITGGRYPRLNAPLDQQQIEIIQADGDRKTPAELSRGTQEQLYLSLRFGLIEEFASHSARLPVIVDDILVNFDPERAERAASALRQLARSNQVLVFTCHPSTVDLFQRVAPEVETLPLPDRG